MIRQSKGPRGWKARSYKSNLIKVGAAGTDSDSGVVGDVARTQ